MVGHPLNLSGLAGTNQGQPVKVPGTALSVQSVTERVQFTPQTPQWFLVLEGELIIDLPYGDFRILKTGDFLRLAADTSAHLEPVAPVILIRAEVS